MHSKVIELTVQNHPGVMSHVTGLFSRRAYNIEGILCGPIGDGRLSRLYLLVNEEARLAQLLKELRRLHDVQAATLREDYDQGVFARLDTFVA